jgi:hypothetical protein
MATRLTPKTVAMGDGGAALARTRIALRRTGEPSRRGRGHAPPAPAAPQPAVAR